MLSRLPAAAALCTATLSAQLTLEQALSPAFPWELTSAPKAGRMAWISSQNGPWNVWVAAAPSLEPRRLTAYTDDDGQELSELAISPDGARLLYVRGGRANRAGDAPNPLSDIQGAEQAVWLLDWAGGEPRRLGEGRSPLFSPDGRLAVWLRGGTVWAVETAPGAKAAALFKARGPASDLAFSPDSAKIAFSSARSDHAFIGVYDLRAKTISWLDPATDRDSMPVWSPDGKSVAFLREPSERPEQPFGARRTATPWSLRVVSPDGTAREVFRAEAGRGSVFQPVASGPSLVWTSSGQLVFPWERTGWKLLYAVGVEGGKARLLTPGAFEVDAVAPVRGGDALVIASNQDDIDRRHLWMVEVAAARAGPLTAGDGIEWAPAALDGHSVALLRCDAHRPARPAVLAGDGSVRDVTPVPADFPVRELGAPQAVKFPATDGMEIPGQLFLPRGLKPGERRPAVIFLHGGSRRQMLLGWNPMYYYHNAYAFNQYLASRGFIVLSVNYRSGTGYGMEFREALNYGATGASEFQDVLGAGLWLRSRADVDAKRIGLWGGSYGGYLTALGLARASELFAAGVDLHGVHEWVRDIQDTRPGSAQMKEDFLRRAWESSPLAGVAGWRSPVLLIHGDDDRNVIFNQTVQLVDELRKRGVEYELLVLPDEVHDFLLKKNWLRAYRAAAGFFERKLGR